MSSEKSDISSSGCSRLAGSHLLVSRRMSSSSVGSKARAGSAARRRSSSKDGQIGMEEHLGLIVMANGARRRLFPFVPNQPPAVARPHTGRRRREFPMPQAAGIPQYLHETYWWAYVHPKAVQVFERQWLVNLILWGNFAKLRDAALDALGTPLHGRTLQVACVYGDFTPRLAERAAAHGSLDVVDVLPIQLANLERKLDAAGAVTLLQRDASDLGFDDASYERVVLFFLLHEMPET